MTYCEKSAVKAGIEAVMMPRECSSWAARITGNMFPKRYVSYARALYRGQYTNMRYLDSSLDAEPFVPLQR